jgi:ABC-type transporter Mla MlaB component
MKIVLTYTVAWLGLMLLAILNGILRERAYAPLMSELGAHQLSSLILIALSALYAWSLTGIYRIQSAGHALLIGLIWLGMTVGFEFAFGYYVMGHPWEKLMHDYDMLSGRLWLLVLLWTAIAPCLFYRLRA